MPQTTAQVKFASSLSTAVDTTEAVEQVANELSRRLVGPADLVVVFATPHHAEALGVAGQRLASALEARNTIGVTAEGVIGVRREVEGRACLSVLAASFPGVSGATLRPFSKEEIDWTAVLNSPEALKETVRVEGGPVKAILFLADPFSTPLSKFLPAVGECFPGVPLVGGMASGSRQAGGNRLLINGRVLRDGAVGLAIGGDVRVDCTVSQGCRPVGRPLVITKSQRHVVQQLAGRNALEVLREVIESLGESDQTLVQRNGLLVGRVIDEYKHRFGRGDFLIRGLIGYDEKVGYFAIGDPQTRMGQTIQFHVRDQKTAREDFQLLLEGQKLHGPAAGALLFTCNGRGTRLFDQPDADATMIHDALGDVPLAGFFAAGELGPVGGQNFVHGHTASLVVFRGGESGEREIASEDGAGSGER